MQKLEKKTIEFHACQLNMTKEIFWQKWEYVDYYQRKTGKKVSKRMLVKKTGSVRKCLDELINTDVLKPGKSKEFTFVQHFFTQSVQFQMYLDCKLSLKPGQCLGIQDFAQNIEISYLDEIKASNWSKTQVTIHPGVFYYKTSQSDEIERQVIVHLSDITKHDPHIVHHMTQDCIDILSKMHPNEKWEKMYLWSDGCSSQYKGKNSFYYLDKFKVPVERNFFGSEHGKNECDAITGNISIQYTNAVKSDDCVISNAHDLTEFLCKTYEKDKSKIFKLVEKEDKDLKAITQASKNMEVQVLSGTCTRTLHQIKAGKNNGCLLTRPYSCFCNYCLNNDFDHCNNKSITGGNFTERLLISDCKDEHFSGTINDEHDENNDDDDHDDYEMNYASNMETFITVENQELKETDLQVNNFIIIPVKDYRNKVSNYPAQIIKLGNNGDIHIDYLKQDFDNKEVLLQSTSETEKNWIVSIDDVIMKLPEPKENRRGRYIFSGKIILNK